MGQWNCLPQASSQNFIWSANPEIAGGGHRKDTVRLDAPRKFSFHKTNAIRGPKRSSRQSVKQVLMANIRDCPGLRKRIFQQGEPANMATRGTSLFATFLMVGRESSSHSCTRDRCGKQQHAFPRHPLRPPPIRLLRPLDRPRRRLRDTYFQRQEDLLKILWQCAAGDINHWQWKGSGSTDCERRNGRFPWWLLAKRINARLLIQFLPAESEWEVCTVMGQHRNGLTICDTRKTDPRRIHDQSRRTEQ